MGGYGTIRIGMKYPQVFSSLYAMSSCCLDPRGVTPQDAALEKLTPEEVAKMVPFAKTTLATSAAWAGNVSNPPFFLDLPTQEGKPVDAVLAQYAANSPVAMASQYVPALRSYKAIRLDIGTKDGLIRGNEKLVEALKRGGVPHHYETYDGDHGNRIPERVEKLLLPFFAEQLSAN
jgi:S-formylglutathione hydrolase FrmB